VTTNERDPASGPIEAAETLPRDVEPRVSCRAKRGVTAASVRRTPCDPESTLSKSGSLVRGLAPKVETPNGYDLGTSRFQQSRCGKYGGKTRQEHSEREAKGKRGWLWCFNASERARGHEDREDQ
jgi:hypothetical protein